MNSFYLSFQPATGATASPHVLRATLRDDVTRRSESRTLTVPRELTGLAHELSQGIFGSPDQTVLDSAYTWLVERMLLQPCERGATAEERRAATAFGELLDLALSADPVRLVVHCTVAEDAPRQQLEYLPWSCLDRYANGQRNVVLSSNPAGQPLEPHRRRISTASLGTPPRVRVLLVLGDIRQADYVDTAIDAARASVEALRKVPGLAVHAVGSDKALAGFAIHGLGATRLPSLEDLRQIVRGERAIAGITDWDVVHFLSHSNATTRKPADSLRLGFATDLEATDLATWLAPDERGARNSSTVLAVFECCNVGGTFLRPVLQHIDHAIGTLGMLSPELGKAWISTFYSQLVALEPIGACLRAARQAIRNNPDKDLCLHWWQLAQWSAVELDHPFDTADAFTLREYARHMRTTLQNLEGEYDNHGLQRIAIPLEIVHHATGHDFDDEDQRHRFRQGPGEPQEVLLGERIRRGGAFLLLGEPGGGKTTSLRQAAHELLAALQLDAVDTAETALADSSRKIPVYVRLPDWLAAPSFHKDLGNLLRFSLDSLPNLDEARRNSIAALLLRHRHRIVVLLDGFDEVPSARVPMAKQCLHEALLPKQFAPNPLVVACRIAARPEAKFARVEELRVLRLDRRRQIDLLSRWLRAPDDTSTTPVLRATQIIDRVDALPGRVRELVSIPLFLGYLGQLCVGKSDDSALMALLQKVQRRHDFFDAVVHRLLANAHRNKSVAPDTVASTESVDDRVDQQMLVLGELAFTMLCLGKLTLPHRDLLLALKGITTAASHLLREFELAQVLRPIDRSQPEGAWGFQHRSLLEAMAAQHLAAYRVPGLPPKRTAEHERRRELAAAPYRAQQGSRDEDRDNDNDPARYWVESFALVAGYRGEHAAEWIQWLRQQDGLHAVALAALALADSQHVPARLVHDVLWDCRDLDWKERRPVYDSLLPPLGNGGTPELRAELLRYVQREREPGSTWRIDRTELWFVDQVFATAEAAAKLSAERKQLAEQRRKLMLAVGVEQLPESIVPMLTTLPADTADGAAKQTYWRFVRKGYAMIGSSWLQQDRREDEALTPIVVRESFWMAEVHVTAVLWALFEGDAVDCTPAAAARSKPATAMNWFESTMFARWLSVHLREHEIEVRLPTEWEWEYAARGKSVLKDELASYHSPPCGFWVVNGLEVPVTHDTAFVAMLNLKLAGPGACGDPERMANPLGLRDMMDFLGTWCANVYGPYFESTEPLENPVGSSSALGPDAPRAQRGGWLNFNTFNGRAACRSECHPGGGGSGDGVRLVCVRVSPQLED